MKRKADEFSDDEEVIVEKTTRSTLYTNKQRVLILASRGITARYRHLQEDLKLLIPHHKKDSKLDSKGDIKAVMEIAEFKSCNQIMYLECRKHQDLYMYLGSTPMGPSVKFHVVNIHTMDELKLTGNCMKGSRALLNFDLAFDSRPHWQVLKHLLSDAFGTPKGHPKSKPFLDRIMSFFIVKNNIWIRNYQIVEKSERGDGKESHLIEIGPRMVLVPIRVFSGTFGGATLYQNMAYVTPNAERSMLRRKKGNTYVDRVKKTARQKEQQVAYKPPVDELAGVKMFK